MKIKINWIALRKDFWISSEGKFYIEKENKNFYLQINEEVIGEDNFCFSTIKECKDKAIEIASSYIKHFLNHEN